jgi:aryl-alcohol dehydrogenase-like predicted oxidoreductase
MHGVSVAQIAPAWLLSKPFVSTVIIGEKTLDQLRDNVAATRLELTAEEITLPHAVGQLPPEYPGWSRGSRSRSLPIYPAHRRKVRLLLT